MITIQILGTSDASTEEQLQAITRELHALCGRAKDDDVYIAFPVDRMQMDLGIEIAALVHLSGASIREANLGQEVGRILEKHFQVGTLIGVQVVEARTVRELTNVRAIAQRKGDDITHVPHDREPLCNISGRCQAPSGARGITNCIHCGKELRERDGQWWTWDADTTPNPQPQRPAS